MKIAVIGGGSTYTPELLDGLIKKAALLNLSVVSLMDIDRERLDIVAGFCQRMVKSASATFSVESTTQRKIALQGADFVLTQVRVGGQSGRHKDIQLGLRHGLVGQETTGVGGFAKALRTIPVILQLCREIEQYCPDAWLINFTNPSGLVTEAIIKHGRARAMGLCNIPLNLRIDVAKFLNVDPDRVELDYLGLNHLSWVRRIMLDGKDVLPQALEKLTGAGRPANIPEELDYPEAFIKALGMIPSSYLRYYYLTRKVVAELGARPQSRAEEVLEIERQLLNDFANPQLCEKPAALEKRGGAYYSRAALELIQAIHGDSGETHIVNVRNDGAIACLPNDCVVEVPARVDAAGAHPQTVEPPPPEIRGLLQHVKAYEELAVEAALTRSRRLAVLALVTHPLIGDAELADVLVDEITDQHGIEFEDVAR
ncbi:MAG: 6-phospho-beta-glucosidase [Deltaproteobacteria bacterium]|nr:6-phospho-beta-glucosidase [Deltaproteobacteria bacterium]